MNNLKNMCRTLLNITQVQKFNIKLILFLMIFVSINAFGQTQMERNSNDTIIGDVVVVKAYSPAVSDVHKIQFTPKVVDTVKPDISFKYYLQTSVAKTNYNVIPIHAATVLPEPLTKLYENCVIAGFGNYTTPLAEYCYSSNRSKKYSLNVHLKHQSSAGKIKLTGYEEKVFAGYSNNIADVNTKYFVKPHKQIQAGIKFNRDVVHNYGFNTDSLADNSVPENDDFKQRYWDVNTYFRMLNTYTTKNHFNYNTGIRYNYLENLQKGNQHTVEIDANMNQYHKKELIGGDIFVGAYIFDKAIDNTTADAKILIEAKPWVKVKGKKWQVKAGLDIVNDHYNDTSFYHFYPNVQLKFNLIENYFVPYLGVSGKKEVNHYYKLIRENPFVSPNINVKNTDYFFIGSVGLQGKTSDKLSYNFGVDYSLINDAYFFINDTSTMYANQFITERDDIKQVTIAGQIFWAKSKQLNFLLKGEYYKYTMSVLEKPWHKPEYKITFSTYYNLRDKIVLHFDIFGLGKQYAKSFVQNEKYIELNGIIDVNLGIEYRYNKKISAFINFNNIAAQKYYKWNQYPMQGFNVLGGLMYAF